MGRTKIAGLHLGSALVHLALLGAPLFTEDDERISVGAPPLVVLAAISATHSAVSASINDAGTIGHVDS